MFKKGILNIVIILIIFGTIFLVWYYFVNTSVSNNQQKATPEEIALNEELGVSDNNLAQKEEERLAEKKKDDAIKNQLLEEKKVEEKYINDEKMQRCESSNAENCLTSIVMKEVVKEKDVSLCNNMTIEGDRDFCISQHTSLFAQEAGDTKLCDNLPQADRDYCYLNVVTSKALKEKKLTHCDGLLKYRDDCIITAATILLDEGGDRTLCNQITDAELKKRCDR